MSKPDEGTARAPHTPGPWRVAEMPHFDDLAKLRTLKGEPEPAEHERFFRYNDGGFAISTENQNVAQVTFKARAKRGQAYCAPDPVGLANARLIAAAPDLLALCERALAFVDSMPDADNVSLTSDLRAAIAKAVRS